MCKQTILILFLSLCIIFHYKPSLPGCVCVCVYRLIYPGGDLNRNTHRIIGTRVTVGTQIKVSMGTKAYKSFRISSEVKSEVFFFLEKVNMQKVSCKG